MQTVCETIPARPITLRARTAEDLMSDNPISLQRDVSVQEAIALLTDRAFDAAPVIDGNGRPVGVVTVTDILVHDREYVRYLKTGDMTPRCDLRCHGGKLPDDMSIEIVDRTTVQDIMTPAVFTVPRHLPAAEVVRKMLDLKVHHLFVAESDGALIGVISACDILRCLA